MLCNNLWKEKPFTLELELGYVTSDRKVITFGLSELNILGAMGRYYSQQIYQEESSYWALKSIRMYILGFYTFID